MKRIAPDYYAAFLKKDRATQDNITTNGMHLQLVSMFNDYVNDGGAFVRGDWLKDLGVSFPTDFEGFKDLLYQVHDTYGCSYTYPMDPGATMAGSEAYYGSELFSLRTDSSDLALYIDDSTGYFVLSECANSKHCEQNRKHQPLEHAPAVVQT